jgi:hypothetical protein
MPAALIRKDQNTPTMLGALVIVVTLIGLVLASRIVPATAQETPVTVTQFPGATVTVSAPSMRVRPLARELVTACPAGYEAISGGWSWHGVAARAEVTSSYPSRRPSETEGGAWTLQLEVTAGSLSVTPYVTCLGGTTQLPE